MISHHIAPPTDGLEEALWQVARQQLQYIPVRFIRLRGRASSSSALPVLCMRLTRFHHAALPILMPCKRKLVE